jgi:hypothetical protein
MLISQCAHSKESNDSKFVVLVVITNHYYYVTVSVK